MVAARLEAREPVAEVGVRGVASDGQRVVAVGGSGTIIHSDDGDPWCTASESMADESLPADTWNGERFIVVGYNGTIIVSPRFIEE